MDKLDIQIVIPVCDDGDKLQNTMDSIIALNYSKENIYVLLIDFSSSDDCYKQMISYDNYHLGIYRKKYQKNRRQMIAEAARIFKYEKPGGKYTYYMVLYSGEILYPDSLQKATDLLKNNMQYSPSMLICECDNADKQSPVFDRNILIDGSKELGLFYERGYDHNIICLVKDLKTDRYRASGEENECRWWSKCARMADNTYSLYMKDSIGCVNEVVYEDELEEILLRWESIIVQQRFQLAKDKKNIFDNGLSSKALYSLAQYAVWRAYKQYLQYGSTSRARECFLISKVISNEIVNSAEYKKINELFNNDKGKEEIHAGETTIS